MRTGRRALAILALIPACSLVYPLGDEYTNGKPVGPDGGGLPEGGVGDASTTEGGVDPNDPPMLVYASKAGGTHIRRWDATSNVWGPASDGPNIGDDPIRGIQLKRSPVTGQRILAAYTVTTSDPFEGNLQVFEWNGTAFLRAFASDDFGDDAGWAPFSIAWLGASNRAIAIYGGVSKKIPHYRVRGDTGWGDEQPLFTKPADSTNFELMDLVVRPHTDELFAITTDSDQFFAASRWNGTGFDPKFGFPIKFSNDMWKSYGAAFSEKSGDFLFMWSADGGSVQSCLFPHGASAPRDPSGTLVENTDTGPIAVAPQPGTDRIASAYLEKVCGATNCDDFRARLWNGTSFDDVGVLDSDIDTTFLDLENDAPTAAAWSGDDAIVFYHKSSHGFRWGRNVAGTWKLETDYQPKIPIGEKASFVPYNVGGALGVLVEDKEGILWAARFDGNVWIDADGDAPLATDLPDPTDFNGITFAVDAP